MQIQRVSDFCGIRYFPVCEQHAQDDVLTLEKGTDTLCRNVGLRVRISSGVWMSVVSVVYCQVEVAATG